MELLFKDDKNLKMLHESWHQKDYFFTKTLQLSDSEAVVFPIITNWDFNHELIQQIGRKGYSETFMNYLQRWEWKAQITTSATTIEVVADAFSMKILQIIIQGSNHKIT